MGTSEARPEWQRTPALEEALERERDFSRTILDTAHGLIVVLDVDGRIQVFNRACQELFGYSEAEIKGRYLWECLVPEDEVEVRRKRFRLLQQGRISGQIESVWLTRDRAPRLVSWQTAILRRRDGAIVGVVATGLDITEKRAAEQALADLNRQLAEANRELERRVAERTAQLVHAERLATLGAVTAGVLHEVRNPLVTLSGFHRLLRKTIEELAGTVDAPRAAELRDRFQAAENAAGAMVEVLENMLSFARKDAVATVFDAGDAVEDASRLLRTQLGSITLRLEPSGGRLPVKGARSQLVQVLTNLLANAADALRKQEAPEIRVRWREVEQWAVIEVVDNGPGVAEASRAHLFRPFFTTKLGQGTGLGLMISRHIVESMAGRLSYQTEAGDGACFVIKLPLASEVK